MRIVSVQLLIIALIVGWGCDRHGVYDSNIDIQGEVWNVDSIAVFRVPIHDTISAHNIYLTIRNSTEYPSSNLYLFVTTQSPLQAAIRDTVELILANDRGKWLGRGFGRIRENQVFYKRNVRIPIEGEYTFRVQHGMRNLNLPGLVSVGVRVERSH